MPSRLSMRGKQYMLVLLYCVGIALSQVPDYSSCSNVVAIPGNPDGVTNAQCAACNNGAQSWYPCNSAAVCICSGAPIPPQFTLPFTFCPNVVAVPGNSHGVTDAQCAKCNSGAHRWYPCDQPEVLCRCSTPPMTVDLPPAVSSSAVPATTKPSTTVPPATTATPLTTKPSTTLPPVTTATPITTKPSTTLPPVTSAVPVTTEANTLPPATGKFSTCADVIAVPGNPDGRTDADCSVCNNGARLYYPCDSDNLCMCRGATIPPQATLPFTYCSNVVAVPGNSHGVTSAQCAKCNGGAYRWYPCDQPNILCMCSSGSTTHAATVSTTPIPQTTTSTPTATITASTAPTASATPAATQTESTTVQPTVAETSVAPAATTDVPTTPASQAPTPTGFGNCSNVVAIPGNPDGRTDADCSACNNGARTWYPCDNPALCVCQGHPIPPQYTIPFSFCDSVVSVIGNPFGITDAQCAVCNRGARRSYPCDQPGILCECNEAGTPRPPPVPPTIPASQGSEIPELMGNTTLETFALGRPFECDAQMNFTDNDTCGGFDYGQVLCSSMRFYMVQAAGKAVVDWRGDCYLNDGGAKNLSLGWFDAGDYVKFGLPMAYSAAALAWGGLEFPAGYPAGSPQRRGLLYNLRQVALYFLEGWNPVTQSLIAQIGDGDIDHSSWAPCYRRNDERPVHYISPTCRGSEVAGDTASALAAMALLLDQFEGSSSRELQQRMADAAIQIYDLAYNYQGTYTDCVEDAAGFYASYSGFQDELAWGATWLAKLKNAGFVSNSIDYLARAEALYTSGWNIDWDNKMLGAGLILYELTGKTKYKADIERRLNYYTTTGPRTDGGLIQILQWGALRHAANAAFVARLSSKLGVGSAAANDVFAKKQLDYILGNNPLGRSYVVGVGINAPVNPHHRSAHDSPTDSIEYPAQNTHSAYGAIVGGPFGSDTAYTDDRKNYVISEIGTDYNALYSGVLASFVGKNCDVTIPQASTLPPTPPPTRGPEASSNYATTLVLLSTWWVQITISPTPDHVDMWYNGEKREAMTFRPDWGNHWTLNPSFPIDNSAQIGIDIYTTPNSAPVYRVIKEGAVQLTSVVPGEVNTFSSEEFKTTVATALNVDEERVSIDNVAAGSVRVEFSVHPLEMTQYTEDAAARRDAAGAATPVTTTVIRELLGDDQFRNSLAAAIQSSSIDVTPAPRPPTAEQEEPQSASQIGCSSRECIVAVAISGIFAVSVLTAVFIMWRRLRALTQQVYPAKDEQPTMA